MQDGKAANESEACLASVCCSVRRDGGQSYSKVFGGGYGGEPFYRKVSLDRKRWRAGSPPYLVNRENGRHYTNN